jgi:hypothetical protein
MAPPKTGDMHWINLAAIHSRLKQQYEGLEYLRQAKEKPPVNCSDPIHTQASFE